MDNENRAGQPRKAARTVVRDGLEVEVDDGIEISDDMLMLLAELATDREHLAMIEMPLAAVSVICHALAYLRNNPTLDGVLKIEADAAFRVMTYVAQDMRPGAQEALNLLDSVFRTSAYGKGGD